MAVFLSEEFPLKISQYVKLFKLVLLYILLLIVAVRTLVQGVTEITPTFIYLWSFGVSIDDESSLFRLFPVPYQLQFYCCKAWLGFCLRLL